MCWKLMRMTLIATILAMIAMIGQAQDSSECDEEDETCALNWSIIEPEETATLPHDQNIVAGGRKPRNLAGFDVKLERMVDGQWVQLENKTYNMVAGTTWSVTFTKPAGNWAPGTYRIRIVRLGNTKATREIMINDQSI